MGTQVWYLMSLILLEFVTAELYDHVSQSFYEKPQSSSAPVMSHSQPPELTGTKQVVLFLTPDQVEKLQAAGATVEPYPEYVSEFVELQQKFKQSIEQQNEPQYQTVTQNEAQKLHTDLENYYKLLNIQEINDDLAQQPTTEVDTEKLTTTPRSKYIKSRQQNKDKEYFAPYIPKKANRPQISNQNTNSEYVRFLPNYESENLRMVPYYARPLSPYKFDEGEAQLYIQAKARENLHNPTNDEERAVLYYSQTTDDGRANNELQKTIYTQAYDEAHSNATIKPSVSTPSTVAEDSEKSQVLQKVPVPVLTSHIRQSVTDRIQLQAQGSAELRESLASIKGLSRLEEQQEKPETPPPVQPTVQTPVLKQNQFSQLLAPLLQHQRITEFSIAAKKAELLNSELEIHSKLQQIKESPQHNDQEYAKEIEKLTVNLGKQNALAEIEVISKSPSVFVNQDNTNRRRPIELVKQTEPQVFPALLHVPESFETNGGIPQLVPLEFTQPIPVSPVPVLQTEKPALVAEEKRIPLPVSKNVYFKAENPHLVQKVVPAVPEIPIKFPIYKPEKLAILRHIWEH